MGLLSFTAKTSVFTNALVFGLISALICVGRATAQDDKLSVSASRCKIANLSIAGQHDDGSDLDRDVNDSDDRRDDWHPDSDDGRKEADEVELVFKFYGKRTEIPTGFPRISLRTVVQVNQFFGTMATTEAAAIQAVCTPARSLDEIVSFLRETSGGTATVRVTPERGGTIRLSDGTRLTIPAGAVTDVTDVNIETEGIQRILDDGGIALVQLSPEGLLLKKPVTLTIPYVISSAADPAQVEAVVFSIANSSSLVDNEINISQPADIITRDAIRSELTVGLSHFSLIALLFHPRVLVVPHLPPDQIKPGDMIFALSGPFWLPGHVGLFERAAPGASLDQALCIEAAPESFFGCTTIIINGRTLPLPKGVFRNHAMSHNFILPGVVYMGARRPKGITLTSVMRDKIIQFASAQDGACYSPIEIPFPNLSPRAFSCVTLVVASYLKAGVNLIPASRLGATAILPYQLFQITAPVTDLTISAGETIKIPIKVDVLVPGGDITVGTIYLENPGKLSTLSMPNSPIASLDPMSRIITLAPTADQTCQSYPLTLNGTETIFNQTATLNLTVKVNDFIFSQETPRGNISDTQPKIGVQIASACNVPLVSASMKLDGTAVSSFSSGNTGSTSASLTFTPSSPLSSGPHVVSIDVSDQEGARKTESFTFTVAQRHTCASWTLTSCPVFPPGTSGCVFFGGEPGSGLCPKDDGLDVFWGCGGKNCSVTTCGPLRDVPCFAPGPNSSSCPDCKPVPGSCRQELCD